VRTPDGKVDPRVLRTQRDVLGAARDLFAEGGWTAVTHAAVAERAGYTRATIYAHWPQPIDLVTAAFSDFCDVAHHTPTGDLHTDLVGELLSFADALTNHHLDRVIATLAERAPNNPALAQLLTTQTEQGSSALRQILLDHDDTAAHADILVPALAGAVLYRILLERRQVDSDFIERTVELALAPGRTADATSPS
jgi:AcrR family transcriptional regulator